jgi:hypothetical protein
VEADCCLGGGCKGYMFALEVKEELAIWPEQDDRERRWVKPQIFAFDNREESRYVVI